ncbi:hypothetical protein [Brevundimonas sp.]|uniref:hypothetical protein n=1 Tax=Brevundimonas sp. TaxID=1871086 RepID=UPI0035B02127
MIHPWTRITVEEHLAAKARLESNTYRTIWIGGEPFKMIMGMVDIDDYTRRDGHVVVMWFAGSQPRDRFGWPEGHEQSPARLYDA